MINIKKYISVIMFLCSISTFAQTLEWNYSIGGSYIDKCHDIEIDNQNNFYLTGGFCNTVDFDLTENTFELSSAVNDKSNIFLLKYNSDQELKYAISLSSNTWSAASEIELDQLGNSYISGNYIASIDFDPSDNDYILTSAEQMIFLAKYDSIGTFKWAKNVSQSTISEMVLDSLGNTYISTSDSIIKINTDGNRKWAIETIDRIGNTSFDNLSNFYYLSSNNDEQIYLNKLDTSGVHIYNKEIISLLSGTVSGNIFYDKSKNLIISGNFWGNGDFNNETSESISILNEEMTTCSDPGSGGEDYPCPVYHRYISKFDTLGNVKWVYDFNKNGPIPSYIKTTSDGTIYVIGELKSYKDFDYTADTAVLEGNSYDYYIAKYDQSCNFLGATKFMGGSHNDCLSGFKFHNDTTVYICGYYFNTIELGLDGISSQLHCEPSEDFFIAKYDNFTINDFTNISSISPVLTQDYKINIFPNPTQDIINFEHNGSKLQSISIYNIYGLLVMKTTDCNAKKINIHSLKKGIYIIEIKIDNEVFRKKIIKN